MLLHRGQFDEKCGRGGTSLTLELPLWNPEEDGAGTTPIPTLQEAPEGTFEAVMCRPYGLIIMDIDMPNMGGMEALQRIRAFQAKAGQAPSCIVAYSGNDSQQSHAAYLAHGFDKCLRKPGSQTEVMALLC